MRIEVARHHHAQVIGHELDHMVVAAHRGVFGEYFRLCRRLHILFNRHQPLFAGLLQDVIEHRHQLHVARLGVFGPLERHRDGLHGGLDHLGLVVDDKRPHRRTADGGHFKRQRLQHHANGPAMQDEHAKDADQADDVTNDDEHGGDSGRVLGAHKREQGPLGPPDCAAGACWPLPALALPDANPRHPSPCAPNVLVTAPRLRRFDSRSRRERAG